MKLPGEAAAYFPEVEIIEMHHEDKRMPVRDGAGDRR